MGQIIAIGGAGFRGDDLKLLRYIMQQVSTEQPKVCFLPQASAEAADYVRDFYTAFNQYDCQPTWLSLFGRVSDNIEEKLMAQDIIYVGGGNTKSMLALWQAWDVDHILENAMNNGTILCGSSAGAICWFEQCVTDSVWPLGTVGGLGFLAGSACPHYDGEPERRPAYLKMVEKGQIIPGIALYDSAAAHYKDGKLHQVVTSHEGAKAFHVENVDGKAQETEIECLYIG